MRVARPDDVYETTGDGGLGVAFLLSPALVCRDDDLLLAAALPSLSSDPSSSDAADASSSDSRAFFAGDDTAEPRPERLLGVAGSSSASSSSSTGLRLREDDAGASTRRDLELAGVLGASCPRLGVDVRDGVDARLAAGEAAARDATGAAGRAAFLRSFSSSRSASSISLFSFSIRPIRTLQRRCSSFFPTC